jgi:poly(A) polymerase
MEPMTSSIPPRLTHLLSSRATPIVLAGLFGDAGRSLYLVGGTVRDALLGRDHGDLDFATDAEPDEIKEIVGDWAHDLYLAGETFGTVGAVRDGTIHEITTFRSEVYFDDSRKPRVAFSSDIAEDLSRRDFTVNAMGIRLPSSAGDEPSVVDPHGGLADLGRRLLRTPLSAEVSFGDDPLRMLRLYRFVSTLGFEPEAATAAAVPAMAERLEIVSAERIRDELSKLLVGEHVAAGLWGLVESGLAEHFLPELTGLALEQDPVHQHKDVLAHTIAVVEKVSPELDRRLAALFHDVGKVRTREIGPDGVTFHHHEVVGARMTRRRLEALRYPRRVIRDVAELVYLHMRPHTYKMGWTDSAVRRYVRDAGDLLEALNDLVRSDVTTRNRKRARAIAGRIDELEERIVALREQEALDALRPPIDGHAVMEYLGLEPGPAVGRAMRMLMDHRLDHGPYDEEEAYALLERWRAEGS